MNAKDWYLLAVAFVYTAAFCSLYTQVPGLYGPTGLLPVHKILPPKPDNMPWYNHLLSFPSAVALHDLIHLPPHLVMELCCLVGGLLSMMLIIFKPLRTSILFLVLWALYLSVYKVGQTFMWFQWDILLLEVGFLSVLVAPFKLTLLDTFPKQVDWPHTEVVMWLVQWLLFRLMFASGIVKLTSHCPTWWSLTALNYHYESQCIPTPLAWYAHQLPEWFQKLCVVGTYFIEIAVPLLFFLPLRSLKVFSFACQVLLQVAIIVSGNYNFFNLLTISLCFSLLYQQPYSHTDNSRYWHLHLLNNFLLYMLITVTVVGYLLALTVYYFSIEVDVKTLTVSSQISFSMEGFSDMVRVLTPFTALLSCLVLSLKIISAIFRCLTEYSFGRKCWAMMWTLLITCIVIPLFALSLVSHGAIDHECSNSIPQVVSSFNKVADGLSISNSYGLFRRMTGVGGRPELIIEGSNNGQDWKEYEFFYKPGKPNRAPVYVAPHQPRLDWQMWFAALGRYEHNPWLIHLIYRLLIGQKEVLQLLESPPFVSPPRFIRVNLYHYHFTPYQTQFGIFNQSEQWWVREFQREYLFPLTWDNQGLQDYLKQANLLSEVSTSGMVHCLSESPTHEGLAKAQTYYEPHTLMNILLFTRELMDNYKPTYVIWTLCGGALLAAKLKDLFMSPSSQTD